jgi:hypothetical protein
VRGFLQGMEYCLQFSLSTCCERISARNGVLPSIHCLPAVRGFLQGMEYCLLFSLSTCCERISARNGVLPSIFTVYLL